MNRKRVIQIAVITVLLIVIVVVIRSIRNSSLPVANLSQFEKEFFPWLRKKEAGESSDPDDKAAANSWPNGVHTNKGITKTTFESNANSCGYSPTYSVFKAMPDSIWYCIYRNKYLNRGLSYSQNIVLATYMGQWFWGGWEKAYLPESRVVAVFNSMLSDREKLSRLVDLRGEYFDQVVKHDPSQAKFLKGWHNKRKDFRDKFSKYLTA